MRRMAEGSSTMTKRRVSATTKYFFSVRGVRRGGSNDSIDRPRSHMTGGGTEPPAICGQCAHQKHHRRRAADSAPEVPFYVCMRSHHTSQLNNGECNLGS